jgi:hypothetical protein
VSRAASIVAMLLVALPARADEEPKATARASKAEVSVGETFVVEVQATGPAGAVFTFPAETVEETVELRTAAAPSPPASALLPGTHRYEAGVFALGDVQVPPIPVHYRLPSGTEGEVKTAPLPLKVVSLLPREKDEQKLADIRGPVGLAVGRAFWISLAALTAAVAVLAFWLWSRRRKKVAPADTSAPALAADEEALRALDALMASGRLARREYRPFYIELSTIAKAYLERRLGSPILEMTTAEMLASLRASAHGTDLLAPMRDLAGAADQIKFARGAGLAAEAERHIAAVRDLILGLEARRKPVMPEGGRAA